MGQLFECVLFTASLAKVRPIPYPTPSPSFLLPSPTSNPDLSQAFVKVGKAVFMVTGSHPDGTDTGPVHTARLKGFWLPW